MDVENLPFLFAITAFVMASCYLQYRFNETRWIAKFQGLTRKCVACETPLERPRPRSCPHCGAVEWRWL